MSHEEFTMLMSLKLDDALHELDEQRLNQHLETCTPCQEQWTKLQQTDAFFTAPSMLPNPKNFTQDVMWQIQRHKAMNIAVQGGVAAIAILSLLQVLSLPWILNNLRQMTQASFWTTKGTQLNQFLAYIFSLFEWVGVVGAGLLAMVQSLRGQVVLVSLMMCVLCLVVLWTVIISRASLQNGFRRG